MHLIQQKLHRYLGESFTLVFETEVGEGATTGASELRIANQVLSGSTVVQDGVASTSFLIPDTLNLLPGHHPFWTSLVISGDVIVVAAGVVKFDRKELNDG